MPKLHKDLKIALRLIIKVMISHQILPKKRYIWQINTWKDFNIINHRKMQIKIIMKYYYLSFKTKIKNNFNTKY